MHKFVPYMVKRAGSYDEPTHLTKAGCGIGEYMGGVSQLQVEHKVKDEHNAYMKMVRAVAPTACSAAMPEDVTATYNTYIVFWQGL